MSADASTRLAALLAMTGLAAIDPARADFTGADPVLPCRYPVGEAAAAVHAAVALAAEDLRDGGAAGRRVAVDVRHAAAGLRGFLDQRLDGVLADADPTGRLPLVGLYGARDGWVQTYGVFPPLRERTLMVLGCAPERDAIARAVAGWGAEALAEALNAAGAPGVALRSAAVWAAHPQGRALAALPLVSIERIADAPPEPLPPRRGPDAGGGAAGAAGEAAGPLGGLRVLDLTRILAGPVCGRSLAEHGADVLQLGAPRLPAVRRALIDTSPGKRSAWLDPGDPAQHAHLLALVGQADVFCQNARPGRLAARGLGPEALAALRPGLVHVSIDCYGHAGPWADRPGFEPLAQAATGWADKHRDADGAPRLVPALPCDHLAGHLAALGVLAALHRRATEGGSWHVRTSLCRTAMWLRDEPPAGGGGVPHDVVGLGPEATAALRARMRTGFGDVDQLLPVARVEGRPHGWRRPAMPPGTHAAAFEAPGRAS